MNVRVPHAVDHLTKIVSFPERFSCTDWLISRDGLAMSELVTAKPPRVYGQVRLCGIYVEQNRNITASLYRLPTLIRPSVTFVTASVNSALKNLQGFHV
jgi:hypothetical protein